MVPPEIAALLFHAALLVTAPWGAELALEPPVRPEGNEPLRLFPLVPAQNLLHCTFQIVETQQPENATEVLECQLVRFQKCLLAGVRICPMERSSAGHRPHAEHIQLLLLAVELRPRLIPIHLAFVAPLIGLRNERLSASNPNSLFRLRTNCRTVDSATSTSGISCRSRIQIRCAVCRCFRGAFRSASRIASMNAIAAPSFGRSRCAALRRWRNSVRDRIPHHPPVHPQLPGYPFDCPDAMLILAPDLLE